MEKRLLIVLLSLTTVLEVHTAARSSTQALSKVVSAESKESKEQAVPVLSSAEFKKELLAAVTARDVRVESTTDNTCNVCFQYCYPTNPNVVIDPCGSHGSGLVHTVCKNCMQDAHRIGSIFREGRASCPTCRMAYSDENWGRIQLLCERVVYLSKMPVQQRAINTHLTPEDNPQAAAQAMAATRELFHNLTDELTPHDRAAVNAMLNGTPMPRRSCLARLERSVSIREMLKVWTVMALTMMVTSVYYRGLKEEDWFLPISVLIAWYMYSMTSASPHL